jgi:hypothetical protein
MEFVRALYPLATVPRRIVGITASILAVVAAAGVLSALQVVSRRSGLKPLFLGYLLMVLSAREASLFGATSVAMSTGVDAYDFVADLVNPLTICTDAIIRFYNFIVLFGQGLLQRILAFFDVNVFPWARADASPNRGARRALALMSAATAALGAHNSTDGALLMRAAVLGMHMRREEARNILDTFIDFVCDAIEGGGTFLVALLNLTRDALITFLDIIEEVFGDIVDGTFIDLAFAITKLFITVFLDAFDPHHCIHPFSDLPQSLFACFCPWVYSSASDVSSNFLGAMLGCVCPNADFNQGISIDNFLTKVLEPCLDIPIFNSIKGFFTGFIAFVQPEIAILQTGISFIGGQIVHVNSILGTFGDVLSDIKDFLDAIPFLRDGDPAPARAAQARIAAWKARSGPALALMVDSTNALMALHDNDTARFAAAIHRAVDADGRIIGVIEPEPLGPQPNGTALLAEVNARRAARMSTAPGRAGKPTRAGSLLGDTMVRGIERWAERMTARVGARAAALREDPERPPACGDECLADMAHLARTVRGVLGALAEFSRAPEYTTAAREAALDAHNVTFAGVGAAAARLGRVFGPPPEVLARVSLRVTAHRMPARLAMRTERFLALGTSRAAVAAELDRIERDGMPAAPRFIALIGGVLALVVAVLGTAATCVAGPLIGACCPCFVAALVVLIPVLGFVVLPVAIQIASAPLMTFLNGGTPTTVDPTVALVRVVGHAAFDAMMDGWENFDFGALALSFVDIGETTLEYAAMLLIRQVMCAVPVFAPPYTCPPLPLSDDSGSMTQSFPEYFYDILWCDPTRLCRATQECRGGAPCRCVREGDAPHTREAGTTDGEYCTDTGFLNASVTTGRCHCWPQVPEGLSFGPAAVSTSGALTCADRGYITQDIIIQDSDRPWLVPFRIGLSTATGWLKGAARVFWSAKRLPPVGVLAGLFAPMPLLGSVAKRASQLTIVSFITARLADWAGPWVREFTAARRDTRFFGQAFVFLDDYVQPSTDMASDVVCLIAMAPQAMATYGTLMLLTPTAATVALWLLLSSVVVNVVLFAAAFVATPLALLVATVRRARGTTKTKTD